MTVKRVLIIVPALLILFLLQSYLWVPTYEQQTLGNPDRLNEYIASSIADAGLLNPVLSADSASSRIETLVFDGLIDRDKDLSFRGRLATSWEVYEKAYVYVDESAGIPGFNKTGIKAAAEIIKRARQDGRISDPGLIFSLDNIRKISIIPPKEIQITRKEKGPGKDIKDREIKICLRAPARIELSLDNVDQDLFQNLKQILGSNYFTSFQGEKYIETDPPVDKERLAELAQELLPAVEHNPVLVFHLRPGVRFHDGHYFDAYDVKFTYESIMDPKNLSPRVADYEPVKAVEIIDPHTLRIVYKRLYSPAVGTWGIGILPEHLLNHDALKKEAIRLGKDPDSFSIRQSRFNRNPIGCGPFVFCEWKSDQYIALDRFDNYWEGSPSYSRYMFRIIPDLLTQEMEFYAGTIDSYSVQPHQVGRLKDDPRFQSFSGLSFGYTYIGYNIRREPFDDPNVRMALSMAIDVDKIIDYVLYGQGERITGPFIKQTDYYNRDIETVPYDPDGALKLLERAGWRRNKEGYLEKNGKRLRFTLITNNGNDLRKDILAIAQDAWKQIGIDVRTDVLEWSVFIQERVDKADFDALILGWVMGIEPDLYQIWHSSQTHPFQLNFVGFTNREADELIIKIRQEYDHERQVKYCRRLHEIIAGEQPYTFLYASRWTAVLDRRILIREVGEDGFERYKKIEPTKTGDYTYHFNRWIKVPEFPDFVP